ncbi:MAG: PadR family transcriptional regulator [Candidatus Neomarinimicrobiota bacterium]
MKRSIIDLTILGFIEREPLSAYDLANLLEKNDLQMMVKISKPAVYKNVQRLLERGYLEGRITKTKRWPEKRICSMTARGRDYFRELMAHFAAQPVRYQFDLHAVALFLPQLPREESEPLLAIMRTGLDEQRRSLERLGAQRDAAAESSRAVSQLQQQLNETLVKWARKFGGELQSERS